MIPERVRRSRHLGEVLVDQSPFLADSHVVAQPVMAAPAPRRARVTFDEPVDPEDAEFALNQIGMPSAGH